MDMARISFIGRVTLLASAVPAILGLFAFGIVLPSIAAEFHAMPNAELLSQLVGGVVGLAFALSSPFMGILISRVGYRAVYFWSMLVFSLAGLSVIAIHDIYLILMTRVVVGVAVAGAVVAAVTGISTLPERDRAQLFGLQTMVGGGLGLVSYILIAKLAALGWRVPFALHALGFLMLPFILTLPKGIAAPPGHHDHGAETSPGTRSTRGIAVIGGLTAAFVPLGLYMGMTGVIPPVFGPFYLNAIGITDPTTIALPLMAAAFVAILSAACYGWLQQRLGINGMFAMTLLVIASGAGLSSLTTTLGQFTAAQMLMSGGLAWTIANLNAAAVLAAPQGASRALAIVNGLYYGAQALLPFAVRALEHIAGPSGVFQGFAAMGVLGGLLYLLRALTERRHPHVRAEAVGEAIAEAVEG